MTTKTEQQIELRAIEIWGEHELRGTPIAWELAKAKAVKEHQQRKRGGRKVRLF